MDGPEQNLHKVERQESTGLNVVRQLMQESQRFAGSGKQVFQKMACSTS
jgi:hypothetical protein